MATLKSTCKLAYVIAHREDISSLQSALENDGFEVVEVRGPYTVSQLGYSPQMRCLVNHANAWRVVAAGTEPVIVLEADFVPVRGFGGLPLPFPYGGDPDEAKLGWLYTGGAILYGFDSLGFPHGHGNTMVGYVVTPAAARRLLEFFEREFIANVAGEYRKWDTYLGIFMRWEAGVLNHIPIYQYGEHGGLPNPEHVAAGMRGWHQADILWGPLSFLPTYANGRQLRYRIIRLRGWARGFVRLVTLRYFDPRHVNADTSRGRLAMTCLAISRIFGFARPFVEHIRRQDTVSRASRRA